MAETPEMTAAESAEMEWLTEKVSAAAAGGPPPTAADRRRLVELRRKAGLLTAKQAAMLASIDSSTGSGS